ncbi:MAG: cupin domain-containing protein [Pseudomonadota bacterium]
MSALLALWVMVAAQSAAMPNAETLIRTLGLEAHLEGGYYRRIFQADHRDKIDTQQGERFTLTSIHYLLTADSPVGHWHLNRSDIVHYFHLGAPITYYLIHPDGRLETVVMGPDPAQGHQLALAVTGGTWKASHLPSGGYGLISEAVAPGFEYEDMTLGTRDSLVEMFPEHADVIKRFTRD